MPKKLGFALFIIALVLTTVSPAAATEVVGPAIVASYDCESGLLAFSVVAEGASVQYEWTLFDAYTRELDRANGELNPGGTYLWSADLSTASPRPNYPLHFHWSVNWEDGTTQWQTGVVYALGHCDAEPMDLIEVMVIIDSSCGLSIPQDAVVGAFAHDAQVFAAPGEISPGHVITEGNTAWVLGTDESGEYYQIIWVCQYLWVPASAMSPNNDALWHGTPLPTQIVD